MEIYHNHHVHPKHAGGDPKGPTKRVTVTEHAEEHRLLWVEHGDEYDRIAWLTLSGQIGKEEAIRLSQSEGAKRRPKKYGKDNHFYGKNHTEESKIKAGVKPEGWIPWNKDIKTGPQDPELVARRAAANIGKHEFPEWNERYWEVIDPSGKVYHVKGLKKFCKDHSLRADCMYWVAKGKRKQHKKGWKCREVCD